MNQLLEFSFELMNSFSLRLGLCGGCLSVECTKNPSLEQYLPGTDNDRGSVLARLQQRNLFTDSQ